MTVAVTAAIFLNVKMTLDRHFQNAANQGAFCLATCEANEGRTREIFFSPKTTQIFRARK